MSKPLRVLIVEDSENDALLLVRKLERSGFELTWKRVETTESLRTALAEQTWDIAFTDHSMPRFRSRDALAQVCSASAVRKLSVVSTRFQVSSKPLRSSFRTKSRASFSESSTIRTRRGLLIYSR